MSFWTKLKDFILEEDTVRAVAPEIEKVPLPAGRTTTNAGASGLTSSWQMIPPEDYNSYWQLRTLDISRLDIYTPQELLNIIADLSPEISYAIWQFQRLCNPGYEYRAYKLGVEDVEDEQGKEQLDLFFSTLKNKYKSVDVVLGRLFMGAYLRGAFCAELVLDASATESIDLAIPDPFSIRFRKRSDPLLKEVWEAGQMQGGNFVSLDIPTFCYVPIDPAPASPYGRSLASPAVFSAVFSLSLLYDIKRVIMQQGYKRLSVSLNTEQAMDGFSFDQQGYATLGEYMRAALDSFKDAYRNLQPDDALIHTDLFEINAPAGTVDANSMQGIDLIIERLEKQLARALKTNGVVLGTTVNRSESDANRGFELMAAGIKSLQHYCENLLENLLSLSLQAKGIQARVEFRFAELRVAEMLRDAQVDAMRIQNARNMYEAGFVSQDEAANYAVGHDANVPEPRDTSASEPVELFEDNSDGAEELNKPEPEGEANRSLFN